MYCVHDWDELEIEFKTREAAETWRRARLPVVGHVAKLGTLGPAYRVDREWDYAAEREQRREAALELYYEQAMLHGCG